MESSITLIRKFKKYKRIADFGYLVSVILLIFGFGAVVWELGYYEDSDRLFHYTMVALYLFLILLSLIYAIASTVIKSLVSKILFYESDPEKYVQVFFSVYRSDNKSYLTWQATVSYYNEDFEACLRYCDEIEKLNKPKIMYYAALNRAKVAFMKGDRETFAAETEKMLTFSANMKRKSVRTTAKKQPNSMICYSTFWTAKLTKPKSAPMNFSRFRSIR